MVDWVDKHFPGLSLTQAHWHRHTQTQTQIQTQTQTQTHTHTQMRNTGSRVQRSAIFDSVGVKAHAWLHSAIIGWKSTVGAWVRANSL